MKYPVITVNTFVVRVLKPPTFKHCRHFPRIIQHFQALSKCVVDKKSPELVLFSEDHKIFDP